MKFLCSMCNKLYFFAKLNKKLFFFSEIIIKLFASCLITFSIKVLAIVSTVFPDLDITKNKTSRKFSFFLKLVILSLSKLSKK